MEAKKDGKHFPNSPEKQVHRGQQSGLAQITSFLDIMLEDAYRYISHYESMQNILICNVYSL